MSGCSLDTNIALYAFTAQDDWRQGIAKALLARRPSISVQVLNEFTNVARNKLALDWRWIDEAIEALSALCIDVRAMTSATHAAARQVAERHKLAFYDACIVASALEARADTLFSEDMRDGLRIDGLTVRNPFAG